MNKEKDLISVIVPIYKVEQYLDECISHIVGQTYRNLEIILVDDGSPDNCPQMCDKWAKKDDRIVVIHKKNAGLGMARNSGLDIATGKYVVFSDSDDYISTDMVQTLYETMAEGKADTIYCGVNRVIGEKVIQIPAIYTKSIFEGNEIVDKVLLRMLGNFPGKEDGIYFYMSVNMGMFSRDLIEENGLRFLSERKFMNEDLYFEIDYLTKAKKVIYIPDRLYYYRYNNMSLSASFDPRRFERIKDTHEQLLKKLSGVFEKNRFYLIETGWFLSLCRGQLVNAVKRDGWKALPTIRKITGDSMVKETIKNFPYQKNAPKRRFFNFLVAKRWNMFIILAIKITR